MKLTRFFPAWALMHKGRTIRKVMGGGGGEFLSRKNFFSLSNSLYELFLGRSMNIFRVNWRA